MYFQFMITVFLLSCILILFQCSSKATELPPDCSCWQSDADSRTHPQSFADCAVGFDQYSHRGNGVVYTVTDESDSAINPKKGTLRYAVTRIEPLWIIFKKDMVINLENVLLVSSNKTIDGSGAKVEIAGGPCITIEHAKRVIIHGITIRHCRPVKPSLVQISPDNRRRIAKEECAGNGIRVSNSTRIWIDQCYLSNATNDLIDLTRGSTHVTVSNSQLRKHDEDNLVAQKKGPVFQHKLMDITMARNLFSAGLRQWLPRYGFERIPNSLDQWISYVIGGNLHPTIPNEGNHTINAPDDSKIN